MKLRNKYLLCLALALTLGTLSIINSACQPTPARNNAAIPTPSSQVISNFVWQTDGLCGYHMLRPRKWDSSVSECRSYMLPGSQSQTNRLIFRAINYQVRAQGMTDGILAQLELFERDPSLDGWTRGIEKMWESNGIEATLLETLSHAKLYAVRSPGSEDLQIVAYVIDQNQPLGIYLTASGIYADLGYLREAGILDDLVTMVSSLQATDYDPANINPELSE